MTAQQRTPEVGQVYVRQIGPPMRLTVKRPSAEHDGWFDCGMNLNGRSFGTRPVPADLLLGAGFALEVLDPMDTEG